MERDKLFNSLESLYAYDTGGIDAGIHNEQLRTEIIKYLDSLEYDEYRILLSTFAREYFVSEEAIKNGYGIEDVALFFRWLNEELGIEK